MGSCTSGNVDPLDHLIKNYGQQAVREYFVSEQVKSYLHSRQPTIKQHLSSKLAEVRKDTKALIQKRQMISDGDLQEVVRGLNVKDSRGVKLAEEKYRLPIKDILGRREVKEKFNLIRQTSQDNIKKEEIKMNKLVEDKLADMHMRINDKKQFLPLFESYRQNQKEATLQEAKQKYQKQISSAENKIDREIATSFNFDNYSKKFVGVVPMEELDSLSKNSKRKYMQGSEGSVGVEGGCLMC